MLLMCHLCSNSYENLQSYFVHLRYAHNITNYFSCPLENCNRLYHSKSNLKKHFKSHHDVLDQQLRSKTDGFAARPVNQYKADKESHCKQVRREYNNNISDDENPVGYNDFKTKINDAVSTFIIELHNISYIPRKIIQLIVDLVSNLIMSEPFNLLKKSLNDSSDSSIMISALQDAFRNFNTDHKRITYLKKQNTFIRPVPKPIGVCQKSNRERNGNEAMVVKHKMTYFMPLREYLEKFLQVPDVLNTILSYQKNVFTNTDVLRNVVNGTYWQETISKSKTNNIIPLTIYYDDFETGNPLGSHSGCQKIGAVYATISSIPPDYSSRSEYIWPVLLFYAQDRVTFGTKPIFNPLLEELQFLYEKGLDLSCNSSQINVKFAVGIMSGDNLALNSILGFHESFSSNNFCRICTTCKAQTKIDTKERPENIRKQQNYNMHCDNGVGIKQKCIWHALGYYHVYNNLTCDVMHDLCEGVLRYDMCLIIKYLVDSKYFQLNHLNSRLQYYTYLKSEKNKPPPVLRRHLLQGQIIFSASEMLCLVRNFRYIVGDLIPNNDPIWCQYLLLLEITEILTSQTFTSELLDYLKNLLETYMECLIINFGCFLKPKHHFLLHYPRIIKKLGPPILASAFKFETKHRELKKIAQSMYNRKNLPFTLAIRHQFTLSKKNSAGLKDRINYGKKLKHDDTLNLYDKGVLDCVDFVQINGYNYSKNTVVLRNFDDDMPLFCKIEKVLISKHDKEVLIVSTLLETLGYSAHYMAYHVQETAALELVDLNDCCCLTPNIIHQVNENKYVDLRC